MCGIPGHARLVGYALHNLPRGSDVPWHRVVNAQGKISLGDLDGMYTEQKRLLRGEGIRFMKDVIDFRQFGWMEMATQSRRKR
jgi:methylated-DNA-protein-cysteine methyltransferase-like protein